LFGKIIAYFSINTNPSCQLKQQPRRKKQLWNINFYNGLIMKTTVKNGKVAASVLLFPCGIQLHKETPVQKN
jgi:hypothetical protein